MSQRIHIHPETPQPRLISQAVDAMKAGGVVIYPTDTVYGLGCSIFDTKAHERIALLRGIKKDKAHFSIICSDLSQASAYMRQLDNPTFKLLKRALPGPFTFVLHASNELPKVLHSKKKTLGLRIPNHPVPLALVQALGHPIITASLKDDDEIREYTTDPEDIWEDYQKLVDLVLDSGAGGNVPSTVVDCTVDPPELIRAGAGDFEAIL